MNPNFNLATVNQNLNSDNYLNARYAPTGNETVGKPFLNFRAPGAQSFTSWVPTSLSISTIKKQMNLPTDNQAFRNNIIANAINVGNLGNKNWVVQSQELRNFTIDSQFCTNDSDCVNLGSKFKCNANYENWSSNFGGNQSSAVCVETHTPELDSGKYIRKFENEGGIGRACQSSSDCGEGYACNMENNIFGSAVQQTGFCAQKYTCTDGSTHFLGYPYNSAVPIAPPTYQNNNSKGYKTEKECKDNSMGGQSCVQLNGYWFATFNGYCPVAPTKRVGDNKQGALQTTDFNQFQNGFIIPSFATSKQSSTGSVNQLQALNLNNVSSMRSPLQYELNANPRPAND